MPRERVAIPVVDRTVPVTTCRAPAVAMHFTITGEVHACCQNGVDEFGDVRTHTLTEIWEGVQRRSMAAALAAGAYPDGCEGCAIEHGVGNRASTPAPPFDRFPAGDPAWPRQLEFTLSNRCNLACVQCNGDNSSTIRLRREGRAPLPMPYGDRFFAELVPFLDHVEVCAFLGGEPFLTPQARRVWDLLIERGRSPRVEVTTNATVWSPRVEAYLHALRMNLALSIDGATAATYEAIRVGAQYDRVVQIRDEMIAAAAAYGGEVHLNFCLMRANWHEVGHFLRQADDLDVHANIIPVWGPSEHSVFTLDQDGTARIVEALEAESTHLRPSLGRNREVWDATRHALADHLDRLGSDRSRAAARERFAAARRREADRRAAERRRRVDAVVQTLKDQLDEWGSGGCIDVRTRAGRVHEIDAPTWARTLGADGWVGLELDALPTALAEGLPPPVNGEPEHQVGVEGVEDLRVVRTHSSLTTPAGPIRFRAVHIDEVERLLIAGSGPLDALGGGTR